MDRIDVPGSVDRKYIDVPGPDSVLGTPITAKALNDFQEEIVNTIESAQISPDSSNQRQLATAVDTIAKRSIPFSIEQDLEFSFVSATLFDSNSNDIDYTQNYIDSAVFTLLRVWRNQDIRNIELSIRFNANTGLDLFTNLGPTNGPKFIVLQYEFKSAFSPFSKITTAACEYEEGYRVGNVSRRYRAVRSIGCTYSLQRNTDRTKTDLTVTIDIPQNPQFSAANIELSEFKIFEFEHQIMIFQ